MALNFPNSPLDGDTWTDPSNDALYEYTSLSNSWVVTGSANGGGTVTLINIVGTNGLVTMGGPINQNGTITVLVDINNLGLLFAIGGGFDSNGNPVTGGGYDENGIPVPAGHGPGGFDSNGNPVTGGGYDAYGVPTRAGISTIIEIMYSAVITGNPNPSDLTVFKNPGRDRMGCRNIIFLNDIGDGNPGYIMASGGRITRDLSPITYTTNDNALGTVPYMELRALGMDHSVKWITNVTGAILNVNSVASWFGQGNNVAGKTPDGKLFVTTPALSVNAPSTLTNMEFMICSEDGSAPQLHCFVTPIFNQIQDIVFTAAGMFWFGTTLSTPGLDPPIAPIIVKLNPNYSIAWSKRYGYDSYRRLDLNACGMGNDLFWVNSPSSSEESTLGNPVQFQYKSAIIRLDSDGIPIFSKIYGNATPGAAGAEYECRLYAPLRISDTEVLVSGRTNRSDIVIARINGTTGIPIGDAIRIKRSTGGPYTSITNHRRVTITRDDGGYIYLAFPGYINTAENVTRTDGGYSGMFIVHKLDSNLTLIGTSFVYTLTAWNITVSPPAIVGENIVFPGGFNNEFRPENSSEDAFSVHVKRSEIGNVGVIVLGDATSDAIFIEGVTSLFETTTMPLSVADMTFDSITNMTITPGTVTGTIPSDKDPDQVLFLDTTV